MSKALAVVGKIAGAVAAVALAAGTLGVGSVATAALLKGAIASYAAVAATVATTAAALTAKKPPLLGSTSSITIGADQATPMWIGETYGGGALVHKTGYGPTIDKIKNPYLAMAIIYSAGGPIAGIDEYSVDFEPVAFGGSGSATGYFGGILFRAASLGGVGGAALTGPWGAIPGWGPSAKLSGKAHVLWSAKWDSKNGKYTSGLGQLGAKGRGVLTWDPRADSTWPGGSGPQRWADPADTAAFDAAKGTWVYSNRPGLHALRYALGTWERDPSVTGSEYVLTFGIGMTIDQIVVEDFCALETVCEAQGWTVSGVLYEPGDKAANLKRILAAGGAEIAWKGGRLGLRINAPRVSLDTIARGDLADGEIRIAGAQPWRDRINAVIPKFKSPAHKWEMQGSPKIVVAEWVAVDGEEKLREETFEFVTDPDQAAALATLALYDAREQGPVDIPIKPRLRRYQGGDRLTLTPEVQADFGLSEAEIVVMQRQFDPVTMTGVLTVMTESAAKHVAAGLASGVAPAPITIPTSADYDGVADPNKQRGAYTLRAQDVPYPITSDNASITIAAFSGVLDDGRTIAFPAGSVTGLAASARYALTYELATGAYAAWPWPALEQIGDSAFVRLADMKTSDGTDYPGEPTPPGGYGGGGGYSGGGNPIP